MANFSSSPLIPSTYINISILRAFLQGDRVTLSIVFRLSPYMSGRVTLGLGLPYHLSRVTLLVGIAVCLLKPCKSSM